jgi:hypothetical protein
MKFNCYNYYIQWDKLSIYKQINNSEEVELSWDFYKTDENWTTQWTQFINILCMYNTYNYIWSKNIIDVNNSPINYVLYSFYKDLRFSKKIVEKKWILYFN